MELDLRGIGMVALGAIALIQTLRLFWQATARRWALLRRARRARRGELDAESLLSAEGYRVVDRQVRARMRYRIDGVAREAVVVADLLVERRGQRYVAEVKTGERAPDPLGRATRRQLLEYAHAFDGAGVLLVDAEASAIHVVEVPAPGARPTGPWLWLALGVAVGWAVTALAS